MDWFKVEADIATNPKVDALSHAAYRVMTYLWGHAMRHETGGHIPTSVVRLVPHVTPARIAELEDKGFLRRNGNGWELHDWEVHQDEALRFQEQRRKDAQRKREWRRGQSGETSDD